MPNDDRVMRAWRTHEYGRPTDALRLDTVPIPAPDAGKLRVKVQAIPFNLNDLERITGGNMMVRPQLPYSPGMEVMGVVDACGEGTEDWLGKRVVAMPKARTAALRSTRSAPRCRRSRCPSRYRCPAPQRCTSRSTSHGSVSSTALRCSPAKRC